VYVYVYVCVCMCMCMSVCSINRADPRIGPLKQEIERQQRTKDQTIDYYQLLNVSVRRQAGGRAGEWGAAGRRAGRIYIYIYKIYMYIYICVCVCMFVRRTVLLCLLVSLCGLWSVSVGFGLWAVGCGLWAVGCGLWAVGGGRCMYVPWRAVRAARRLCRGHSEGV